MPSGNLDRQVVPLQRIQLFGCPIDNVTLQEATERVEAFIQSGVPHRYFAMNVRKVAGFRQNATLQSIANNCDLVTADGQPIVWASRLFRKPLKERVTGIDLMESLIELSARKGYGVFFLGARPEILERLLHTYQMEYPHLAVAGSRDGYWTVEEEQGVVQMVRAARADIVFLGMSSPAKELFAEKYYQEINAPFLMGVGGAFDVVANLTSRAPAWLQRVGFEWIWRVAQEPLRLSVRYLEDGFGFALAVIHEWRRNASHSDEAA